MAPLQRNRWRLVHTIPDPHGRCCRVMTGLTLLLAALGGCRAATDSDGVDADLTLVVDGAAVRAADAAETGAITFLGYLTAEQGDRATERITALSGTAGGDVVIGDLPSCQVLLIHLAASMDARRVGRCGDGPGEFSFVAGAGVAGDTVIGYDAARRQVLAFDSGGTEVKRISLLPLLPEQFGVFEWNGLWSTDRLLLTRSVGPLDAADVPSWRTPLVMVDVGTDPATVRALPVGLAPVSERSATSQRRPALLHGCVEPGGGRHLVVVQGLAVESVVLDAKWRPTAHRVTRLPWMRPTMDSTGFPVPAARRWYVACGTASYAIGYRAFEGSDERAPDTHGYLEVRRYDGALIAAREWTEADSASRVIGAPRALLGDTLVSVVLDAEGWQRAAMWRVTP